MKARLPLEIQCSGAFECQSKDNKKISEKSQKIRVNRIKWGKKTPEREI
jgi:hypothetical protein